MRPSPLSASSPPSAQQTVFRSTVDVIAVDVQVVDGDGNPIGRIGPESFQVSINGQRRKVVSAQFIGSSRRAMTHPTAARPKGEAARSSWPSTPAASRSDAERAPIEGAQNFVQHLDPSDRVGLFVYPAGTQIAPTTQRTPITITLGRVDRRRKIRCARITT